MRDRSQSQAARLRPPRFDDLGLRRALSDRLLPLLVAAMAFLAALAFAGFLGAAALGRHWQEGAGAALTIQVPRPGAPAENSSETRRDAVLAILRKTPGVASADALSEGAVADLLRPWLGAETENLSLPLPAVIEVQTNGAGPDLAALGTQLAQPAPGTLTEGQGVWVRRITGLARSLQACAGAVFLLVIMIAAAMIAVATRAGLAVRRDSIEIVHGLGATDGYISRRFAARATLLAAIGALIGAAAALPVLLGLAHLAAPFTGTAVPAGWPPVLPRAIWLALPALPVAAACIGWSTANRTVRSWLRQLP